MKEILVVDRKTGLPKRIDGTIPDWALERKKKAEEYCENRGWPKDFKELSLYQISEIVSSLGQNRN